MPPPLHDENGPMGLSPYGQRIGYIVAVLVVSLGLAARFWSYRNDRRTMVNTPHLRWLGDASVVISFVLFLTVACIQFKLLDMTMDSRLEKRAPTGGTVEGRVYILKALYASRLIYSFFIYILKGGFISHYIAISYVSSPRLQILLCTTVAMSMVGAVGTVMATAMFCMPISRVWTPGETESCNPFSDIRMLLPFSYMNVVLDLMILTYPVITISQLHLPLRRKLWYLVAVVLTGIWPAIAATYRFYLVVEYLDAQRIVHTSPQSTVALASIFEMASLLFSVSFPAYRVLRRKLWKSPFVQRMCASPLRRHLWEPFKRLFQRRTMLPPGSPPPSPGLFIPARAQTWETVYSVHTLKTRRVARTQRVPPPYREIHNDVLPLRARQNSRDSANSQNPFGDIHRVPPSPEDAGSCPKEPEPERVLEDAAARRRQVFQAMPPPSPTPAR